MMKEGRGETLDTTLYHTSDIITTLSHVGEGGYFNPPAYRCNHATLEVTSDDNPSRARVIKFN